MKIERTLKIFQIQEQFYYVMNRSLTAKLKKIYFFPNISTTRVIIDILFVLFFLLQNDVVRHCLFWFHLLHCCGLYIHVFSPRAAYIFITSVESVSVQFCTHVTVLSWNLSMCFLCCILFICFCISHLIQRRLSRLFVSVSVCLSVVWTDSFSIGKYSRNPLYNTTDPFSTKLVTSYPWVQGSHFFFFSNRLHTH